MDTTEFDNETKKSIFRKAMLAYWRKHGRKKLPWRQTNDPWKILVAEILLRKTTVRQAEPVYLILSNYSPDALAQMDELELQKILYPLGIYEVRAKQLLRVASTLMSVGSGELKKPEVLEGLPGVGQYIKNAVMSSAFGLRKPGLDTNMIRVIQRVFGYVAVRTRAREDRKLWKFAEELMPKRNCRGFNWAVLDFAADVCKARNPLCSVCPINSICNFYTKKIDA